MSDIQQIIAEKGMESLEEIQKWAKTTQDFAVEQVPLLVQEIINWGLASRITAIVFCLIVMLICMIFLYFTILAKKAQEFWQNQSSSGGTDLGFLGIIGNISAIVTIIANFVVICNYTVGVIFILYAPRLYVIQELTSLLKH